MESPFGPKTWFMKENRLEKKNVNKVNTEAQLERVPQVPGHPEIGQRVPGTRPENSF